ncbi:MAG: Holliday junction resolvase-like protein [archaeon]
MDLFSAFLVIAVAVIAVAIGYLIGKAIAGNEWKEKIRGEREDAIKKSRAVLGGQFSEQLAPFLPDFPYNPTEVRFIGKPVDFLVFRGMDEKKVEEVIFVEVKSGKARMNPVEKTLKDAIEAKKVSWKEYRIPEGITMEKEKD